ncbi:MAG: class I SAM-dependent methyltransferase [Marinagarivorans sp.]|nr:class I SAM-dependent methyltransferase [Marinagarivorans sp.]
MILTVPSINTINIQPLIDALLSFDRSPKNTHNAQRIFHGRGQCFAGLENITVDAFYPLLLMTVYTAPDELQLQSIIAAITAHLPREFTHLLLQRRDQPNAPYGWLKGLPLAKEESIARRGNLKFHLDFTQQNCGYFLDMEPGRRWLEACSKNAKVLNLFAYTCAFSVVANAAGADKIVNVDLSRRSLTTGRENHRLNHHDTSNITFLGLDILKSWGKIKKLGPYDVVIVDPPSFQKGSFVATKDYQKVVRRLPELLNDKGKVLACLNAPEFSRDYLRAIFSEQAPDLRFVERLAPSDDFPDVDIEQQLKLLVYTHSAKV